MEDPHASPSHGSNSRSTISSLLNDDASTDAQEADPFASYGSPFLPDLSTAKEDVVTYDGQPPSKKRRQSIDLEAEMEPTTNDLSNPGENGDSHNQPPMFPSLHLHPLSGATVPNPLPSPALLQQPDHHIIEEERRALAEEKRKVESERQQLEDDKRAFEEEKRQFSEEKKRWLDEKDKQASGTGGGKPTISFFGRRAQTQLEEQSFGCVFVKNNAVLTKPSPHFAQAYVVLQDMMTQKTVELPLAVGIGSKDSSLPKKAVQDLGSILIPQQTRDYGPSYAKTGYLVVNLKDQKGGAPVRIEAVEGSESDVGQTYFIITKGDLASLRCLVNEKEGTISNDHTGNGETTEAAVGKGKRKK